MTAVVVWGTGAIGGLLAGRLACSGLTVHAVDTDADHLAAISRDGLVYHGPARREVFPISASTPEQAPDRADWVVLAVRARDFASSLHRIEQRYPRARLFIAMNGLWALSAAERWGGDRVAAGVVHWGAQRVGPGIVRGDGQHELIVGALGKGTVDDLFTPLRSGFEVTETDDITGYLWVKTLYYAVQTVTAVVDADIGPTLREPVAQRAVAAVVREGLRAAATAAVRLPAYGAFNPHTVAGPDERARGVALTAIADRSDGRATRRTGQHRQLAAGVPTDVAAVLGPLIRGCDRAGTRATALRGLVRQVAEIESGERAFALHNLEEVR